MADKKQQVEGVIARMRKSAEELLVQANDLEALLHGEDTTGQQIRQLFIAWNAHWHNRHQRPYAFTERAKNSAAFKKLLATMTVQDITARMGQYLASRDPFSATAGYPIGLFLTSINKFPGAMASVDDAKFLTAPVSDCQHVPTCLSDQAHTKKRAQEMRA